MTPQCFVTRNTHAPGRPMTTVVTILGEPLELVMLLDQIWHEKALVALRIQYQKQDARAEGLAVEVVPVHLVAIYRAIARALPETTLTFRDVPAGAVDSARYIVNMTHGGSAHAWTRSSIEFTRKRMLDDNEIARQLLREQLRGLDNFTAAIARGQPCKVPDLRRCADAIAKGIAELGAVRPIIERATEL